MSILLGMSEEDLQQNRELVGIAVEYALLTMGPRIVEKVEDRLKKDYNIRLMDSLDNPKYLKEVLCDLFGDKVYQEIIRQIYAVLDKSAKERVFKKFLYVMEH